MAYPEILIIYRKDSGHLVRIILCFEKPHHLVTYSLSSVPYCFFTFFLLSIIQLGHNSAKKLKIAKKKICDLEFWLD